MPHSSNDLLSALGRKTGGSLKQAAGENSPFPWAQATGGYYGGGEAHNKYLEDLLANSVLGGTAGGWSQGVPEDGGAGIEGGPGVESILGASLEDVADPPAGEDTFRSPGSAVLRGLGGPVGGAGSGAVTGSVAGAPGAALGGMTGFAAGFPGLGDAWNNAFGDRPSERQIMDASNPHSFAAEYGADTDALTDWSDPAKSWETWQKGLGAATNYPITSLRQAYYGGVKPWWEEAKSFVSNPWEYEAGMHDPYNIGLKQPYDFRAMLPAVSNAASQAAIGRSPGSAGGGLVTGALSAQAHPQPKTAPKPAPQPMKPPAMGASRTGMMPEGPMKLGSWQEIGQASASHLEKQANPFAKLLSFLPSLSRGASAAAPAAQAASAGSRIPGFFPSLAGVARPGAKAMGWMFGGPKRALGLGLPAAAAANEGMAALGGPHLNWGSNKSIWDPKMHGEMTDPSLVGWPRSLLARLATPIQTGRGMLGMNPDPKPQDFFQFTSPDAGGLSNFKDWKLDAATGKFTVDPGQTQLAGKLHPALAMRLKRLAQDRLALQARGLPLSELGKATGQAAGDAADKEPLPFLSARQRIPTR